MPKIPATLERQFHPFQSSGFVAHVGEKQPLKLFSSSSNVCVWHDRVHVVMETSSWLSWARSEHQHRKSWSRLAGTFTCLDENEKPSLFREIVHVNRSSSLSRRAMMSSRTLGITFGTGMSCLSMKVNILDDSDSKSRPLFKSPHNTSLQGVYN